MPSIGFHNASYVYNERNADDDYYIAKNRWNVLDIYKHINVCI